MQMNLLIEWFFRKNMAISSDPPAALQTDIAKIQGVIQHYAWGGHDFLPQLLQHPNPERQPFAEYWMGAHPKAPSRLADAGEPLDQLIAAGPEVFLGEGVAAQFANRLPYLFKVLDVKDMLSIQAHPTKAAAEIGFAQENVAGIPLSAPHRNYKDDNHKPEIMVALTEFWLLHGFRSQAAIRDLLESVPEFAPLLPHFAEGSLFTLYKYIMELPQAEVDALLQPLVDRLIPAYQAGQIPKEIPDFWAARAAVTMPLPGGHLDRGIFSIYLFNLVKAEKGQGIFQDAGIPHAYLEGVNVELMANSDNVLRGGLTPKHIDVPELLDKLIFEPVTPHILDGQALSPAEKVYKSPAPDFELSKIEVDAATPYHSAEQHAPDIVILIEGRVSVDSDRTHFPLTAGEVFCAPADVSYRIEASQPATLFRATVPLSR
jgi:mannose-6-phosphate isomerase